VNRTTADSTGAVPPGLSGWLGWMLPVGFIAVAAGLVWYSGRVDIPLAAVETVDRESLVVGPRRVAMTDPPRIAVEGRLQDCNGCHQIFQSVGTAGRPLDYHGDVHLSHGLNNRCVNCHDSGDMERLTLRDGATVAFKDTPQLCSQCHGTVYRDWQRGTHGKTLGSWVTRSAEQRRLSCNECHNPHSPKYDPYVPLPGPNTLRMGDQKAGSGDAHAEDVSPLQRWLIGSEAARRGGKTKDGAHP